MSSESFQQLKNKIQQCRICETDLPLGANPVLRVKQGAKILIAGQAPGNKVHETSIPFNDPSGIRLRKWMGVSENAFYDDNKVAIIPMGFCYPGRGKSGDLPPRKECVQTWHQQLIGYLNVQLILAIGVYAQKYYLADKAKNNLTETVRAWQEYLPNIIPLPHPSPRNNIWLKRNSWFEKEVIPQLQIKVKQQLKN